MARGCYSQYQMNSSIDGQSIFAQKPSNAYRQKRNNMTLELRGEPYRPQKNKFGLTLPEPAELSSPDMKNLNSHEMEKMLSLSTDNLQVCTPNTICMYLSKPTSSDPEMMPESFINMLGFGDLNVDPSGLGYGYWNSSNNNAHVVADGPSYHPNARIKDEPQTVPSWSTPPSVSPINMESQQQLKTLRKKERNRVAAAKCRQKKLEKIDNLKELVRRHEEENDELEKIKMGLQAEVYALKQKLTTHRNHGCRIVMSSNSWNNF